MIKARIPALARVLFAGLLTISLMALPYQTAEGQGVGEGLILLPEQDGMTFSGSTEFSGAEFRVDPLRRMGKDDAQESAAHDDHWISPLRVMDLAYPVRSGITRISGEREIVNFNLYAGHTNRQQTLQIATVSGINNLPERSSMRVIVNGEEIGMKNLNHVEEMGLDRFILDPDILLTGRNHVRIEFRQFHRIFCGPEASYDLWTDIDLTKSGLIIETHDYETGPASDFGIDGFMMALAAQAAGNRPVEIRGIDTLGSEKEKWRSFLVSRLNQALAGAPLLFAFEDYWTYQANARNLARITILPAPESRLRFAKGGDGARVMVLEISQGTQPEDLLAGIIATHAQEQDTRATLIMPQQDVPFAAFGVENESFSQRYALRDHAFRLPDDWLVLTAAKARIELDYAYADNLPRGSMVLLKINGTAIRLLPLRGEGGRLISRFPIDFEARLMRAGTNVLSFELFVPGEPPSLPCSGNDRPVLQIANSSTINVPYSPSMSIPDMHLAFSALTPDSLRRNELTSRAFSDLDELTIAAALARTRAAIRPPTLHLIALEDLGSIPTGEYIADRKLLEDAVLQIPSLQLPGAGEPDVPQYDPFHFRQPESRWFSLALSSGWARVEEMGRWAFERVFPSGGNHLNNWLAERSGQAILFQLDPMQPDEIWMLRNPESDMQDIAHAMARARAHGNGPRGQVAVLTHEGTWENWFAPDRRPYLLEPWSRQNFRAAMGNHVSARPIFYTILMLGIAAISAFVALRLVVSTREHKI